MCNGGCSPAREYRSIGDVTGKASDPELLLAGSHLQLGRQPTLRFSSILVTLDARHGYIHTIRISRRTSTAGTVFLRRFVTCAARLHACMGPCEAACMMVACCPAALHYCSWHSLSLNLPSICPCLFGVQMVRGAPPHHMVSLTWPAAAL